MKSSFKNALLATSCLAVFLTVSPPGFAMEVKEENHENKKNSLILPKIESNKKEEEPYFTVTDFGIRQFDSKKWSKALFTLNKDEKKEKEHFQILKDFAFEGDKDALQKFYQFSVKECMGIKWMVDEEKAAEILRIALKHQQNWEAENWVVQVYKQKIQSLTTEANELVNIKKVKGKINKKNLTLKQKELIQLSRDAANTPLASSAIVEHSQKMLEFLYPFDGLKWTAEFCNGTPKEDLSAVITRLREYGYYKYFNGLYELTTKIKKNPKNCFGGPNGNVIINGKTENAKTFRCSKLQFLKEGAALGDQKALNDLYFYYREKKQWEEAIEICLDLAQNRGHHGFMHNLYIHYTEGEGDPEQAFKWLTKAADKGRKTAILELVIHYWYAQGPKQDFLKTFKWLATLEPEAIKLMSKKQKNDGEIDSAAVFVLLGRCYHYGNGVEKDEKKAFNYFKLAADLGEANALIHIAMAYQYGWGIEKNLEEAIKRWEKASKRYPNESLMTGLCYDERGLELQQQGLTKQAKEHFRQAYKCYQKANNNPQAIYNMAYHNAIGNMSRGQDLKTAAQLYQKAAVLGSVEAMYSLGIMNLFGEEKNLKDAEKWLKKAAEQEHSEAIADLSYLYDVEYKDVKESFNWAKKAAELGNVVGLYNYGVFLLRQHVFESKATEEDEILAVSYLNKAAEKGFSPAMTRLAKYYLDRSDAKSEEGKLNLESAYFWLKKAANLENFEAKTLLTELENETNNNIEDFKPSEELEKCLENFEKMEKGELIVPKELEMKNEKPISPFEDITEETKKPSKTESPSKNQIVLEETVEFQNEEEDKESSSEEEIVENAPKYNKNTFNITNIKYLREQLRNAKKNAENKLDSKMSENSKKLSGNPGKILKKLFRPYYEKITWHLEIPKREIRTLLLGSGFVLKESEGGSSHFKVKRKGEKKHLLTIPFHGEYPKDIYLKKLAELFISEGFGI